MMIMKKNILYSLLLICFTAITVNAEGLDVKEKYNITARLGYSVGGTMPMGFPEEMRGLNSYSPKGNYRFGVDIERMFTDKFGVQAGIFLERKGFKSDVSMRQYDVILERGGERITGPFTGNVVINIVQTGVTIPIQASWWINNHSKLKFGPYISYITDRTFNGYAYGNKVYDDNGNWTGDYDAYLRRGEVRGEKIAIGNIDTTTDEYGNQTTVDRRGTFSGEEFNNYLRKFQWGVDLGYDYYFTHRIGAFADLTYGLNSAFNSQSGNPVSMGLYPLYFTVGVVYKFK